MGVSRIGAWSRSLVGGRTFAQHTLLLFAASTVGNGLGYIYHLFAGRALGPESFGVFGSLFAVFYVASLMGDALRIAVASQVASLKGRVGAQGALASVGRPLLKLLALGSLPALALLFGAPAVASFFHMEAAGPVYVLGGALLTVLVLFMVLGLVQGLQLFPWLAMAGYVIPHSLKLLFGVFFVWLGWGLAGVIWALPASNLAAIAVGGLPLLRLVRSARPSGGRASLHLGGVAIPALMMGLIICFPTSVDVMLVTHYFAPHNAGVYNAVAAMGKVVLFLPIAVSLVMLPQVSEQRARGMDTAHTFAMSLGATLAASGGVALLYWLMPGFLVRLLFGAAYLDAAALLGWYGVAICLFSANYLFAQYELATSRRWGVVLAIAVTLAEVFTIVAAHESLLQVVMVLLVGNLLLFLMNLLRVVRRQSGSVSG